MKSLLVVLILGSFQAKASDLKAMLAENLNQTPFAMVEALYNRAGYLRLEQLPTAKGREIHNWNCANVDVEMTRADIKADNYMSARAQGIIAQPAIQRVGPLFPGTPAPPPQYVTTIIEAPNDGSSDLTPEWLGQSTIDLQSQINSSPDLQQIDTQDTGKKTTDGIELIIVSEQTLRSIDNQIIVKIVMHDDRNTHSVLGYRYCWQQTQSKLKEK